MKGERIQVTATPTTVVAGARGDIAYPLSAILQIPTGGQTVYFGGSTVDITQGFPVAAGSFLEVDLVTEILYAVTATTSQYIFVLRRGD